MKTPRYAAHTVRLSIHLAKRSKERAGWSTITNQQLLAKVQAGEFTILHWHNCGGLILKVADLTIDLRPDRIGNGIRAIATVFHKYCQWNHQGYQREWSRANRFAGLTGEQKEQAHLRICAKLGLDPR